jgi:DNA-binding response OmpR family regulator
MTLTPRASFILDLLAEANGPVRRWDLVDRIAPGSDDDGVLRLYICRIRDVLGDDAISTARGLGYQLTEKGRAAYDRLRAA